MECMREALIRSDSIQYVRDSYTEIIAWLVTNVVSYVLPDP